MQFQCVSMCFTVLFYSDSSLFFMLFQDDSSLSCCFKVFISTSWSFKDSRCFMVFRRDLLSVSRCFKVFQGNSLFCFKCFKIFHRSVFLQSFMLFQVVSTHCFIVFRDPETDTVGTERYGSFQLLKQCWYKLSHHETLLFSLVKL